MILRRALDVASASTPMLAIQQTLQEAVLSTLATDAEAGNLAAADVWVEQVQAPEVHVGLSDRALYVLNRHLYEGLRVEHDVYAQVLSIEFVPMDLPVSWAGRLIGRLLPYRRKVMVQNMRRVYGDRIDQAQLEQLVLAHYSHLAKLLRELISFRFKSVQERAARVRVEGVDLIIDAFDKGRGMLIVTGHFGNFEVSTVSGIEHFPQAKGRIHFLRRPIKPKWLSDFLTRRFNQAGFGVIGRRGSLDEIVSRLEAGDAIVFPFDQYAHKPDGIAASFFGSPAGTYKSMAVLAMATGAPVISGSSWRESDGSHVLKFWTVVEPLEHDDVGREITLNTERYNHELERMILRKPAQWWWVHRRWKNLPAPR